jgi:hypothetical protein
MMWRSRYILAAGEAEASITMPGGQPDKVVKQYQVGGWFGEIALIRTDLRRQAHVDAKTDVTCLRIDAADFARVLGPCKQRMEADMQQQLQLKAELTAQTQPTAPPPAPTLPPPPPAPSPALLTWFVPPTPSPPPAAHAGLGPAAATSTAGSISSLPPLPAGLGLPPLPMLAAAAPPMPAPSVSAAVRQAMGTAAPEKSDEEQQQYLQGLGRRLLSQVLNGGEQSTTTYLIEKFMAKIPMFQVISARCRLGRAAVQAAVQAAAVRCGGAHAQLMPWIAVRCYRRRWIPMSEACWPSAWSR